MVRLNRQSKECKRVMVIDATDYPLVRVIKPLSTDPRKYEWALWTFREFDEAEGAEREELREACDAALWSGWL